jgi:plasmid stabilization system protein ParE
MARYLLTDCAKGDLFQIIEFLRERNPRAAGTVCRDLRNAMRKLAEFPGMGHFRDDLAGHGVRFWSIHSYLIVYRTDEKPLQVLRVLHGAQNLARYFKP